MTWDLVLGGEGGLELLRNNLQGPVENAGDRAFPSPGESPVRGLAVTDLDRDGDLDLLVAHTNGLRFLRNLRQGVFEEATEEAGLAAAPKAASLLARDLNRDGHPDLVTAGEGLSLRQNQGGGVLGEGQELAAGAFETVVAFDADLDGRLDLAAAGEETLIVLHQQEDGTFRPAALPSPPPGLSRLVAFDADGDGDEDLAAAGSAGLYRLTNTQETGNGWLALRLRGLDQGNSKNNLLGLGASVEAFSGDAYQFFESTSDLMILGLGQAEKADVLRIVWTNGVPQNRLQLAGRQWVVEEQILKAAALSSIPGTARSSPSSPIFSGELPWACRWRRESGPAPTRKNWCGSTEPAPETGPMSCGSPKSSGRRLSLISPAFGWSIIPRRSKSPAAFASSWGAQVEDRVLASRNVRPIRQAWDGQGRDVTQRVRHRDEVYADGYLKSPYQGVAREPWSLTFDLGMPRGAPSDCTWTAGSSPPTRA